MLCFRIAALRKQVERLAAVASARAEENGCAKPFSTQSRRASFRALTEAETETIVGRELLATLATAADRS